MGLMKRNANYISMMILFAVTAYLLPNLVWAQDLVEVPMDQFLTDLLQSLGGLKGASAMAIAAMVVQTIMKLMKTKLGEYAGKYRLLAVYGLTVIGGVLSLKVAGVSWLSSLVHANTLAALQVFGHQIFSQFFKKES